MSKITLIKNNSISLGKYTIATNMKCYQTIFFSEMNSSMSIRELKLTK